jgi:hypothetical protein
LLPRRLRNSKAIHIKEIHIKERTRILKKKDENKEMIDIYFNEIYWPWFIKGGFDTK